MGVFESMRCYHGKVVYFDEHLNRLKRSCRKLRIKFPFSLENLREEILQQVKASGLRDAYVRLTLRAQGNETHKEIIIKKYTAPALNKYTSGFKADISGVRQNNPCLARIKTVNRQAYETAFELAKKRGFDEALIFNHGDYLCEATRSNVFLVFGRQIVTPQLKCGCLEGIVREVIFDLAAKYGIRIYEGKLSLEDMLSADEAFLTNSLMGVMPLVSVCGKPIANGKSGKLTKLFIKKYRVFLKNGSKEDKITI